MATAEPDPTEPDPVVDRGEPQLSSAAETEAAADCAVAAAPSVLRMLDIGCGNGALLRELESRVPYAEMYEGVDPDGSVLPTVGVAADPRLTFRVAAAAGLPYDDGRFDLAVSLRCFHLWPDQAAGLRELARVLRGGGHAVIADRLADGAKGQDRIRTGKALAAAAESAGLRLVRTERLTRRLGRTRLRGYVLAR